MMTRHVSSRKPARRGFSLIISILMMMLLLILALGLLSLSTISLRASGEQQAMGVARANARLAVMLALGQLQAAAGQDQRITAPAEVAGSGAPPQPHQSWTGVWKAAPNRVTDFPAGRKDSFLSWLVSAPDSTLPEAVLNAGASEVVVHRMADGRETRVPRLDMPGGGLAWWTADEAMKASIDLGVTTPDSDGAHLLSRHAPPSQGPQAIDGMAALPREATVTNRLVTPASVRLAASGLPENSSAWSGVDVRSVLADVRKGGLKKDFSTLFEQSITDIQDFGVWQGKTSAADAKTYLYGDANIAYGARWPQLYRYYNLYKDVTFAGGEPRLPVTTQTLANWASGFGDEAGGLRYPRIVKIAYVFSYFAEKTGTDPANAYTLELGIDAFVTLWNPYDVRLTWPSGQYFLAKISKGLPFQFQWQINGTNRGNPVGVGEIIPDPAVNVKQWVDSVFYMPGGAQFTMGPGETRVFSLDSNMRTYNGDKFPDFLPGIAYKNVLAYKKVLGSSAITGAAADKIAVGMKPFQGNSGSYGNNAEYLDYWVYDVTKGYPNYEQRGDIVADPNSPFLRNLPEIPVNTVRSVTFAEASAQRLPFAAFVIQMKTARDAMQPTPAFLSGGTTKLTSRLGSDPVDFALDQMEYRMQKVSSFQEDILQTTLPGDPEGPDHSYIASGRLPPPGAPM
ncbi:MAG: hypothetical protein QM755_02280 [Luteolibacter sp.]